MQSIFLNRLVSRLLLFEIIFYTLTLLFLSLVLRVLIAFSLTLGGPVHSLQKGGAGLVFYNQMNH